MLETPTNMDAYSTSHKENVVEMGAYGPIVRGVSAASGCSKDDVALARLGKKPVLKRNFGFMTILGFSCTILITWEGSLMCVHQDPRSTHFGHG